MITREAYDQLRDAIVTGCDDTEQADQLLTLAASLVDPAGFRLTTEIPALLRIAEENYLRARHWRKSGGDPRNWFSPDPPDNGLAYRTAFPTVAASDGGIRYFNYRIALRLQKYADRIGANPELGEPYWIPYGDQILASDVGRIREVTEIAYRGGMSIRVALENAGMQDLRDRLLRAGYRLGQAEPLPPQNTFYASWLQYERDLING